MKRFKQRLTELNNAHNNRKGKSHSDGILLFIAEAVAETNSNVKWLIWIMGVLVAAGLGVLIKMAFG